jgi:cytochrome c biogenesis protein CcmG/thiol:disulfide interchange protein DsbE
MLEMAEPEFYSGKSLYPIIGVLIALSALFGLVIMPRLAPASGMVDQPAPDFALPVVHNGAPGARMKLSDLRDKVVILDFWATWCGPCAAQAPILDRVARRYKDDVVVLGINVGEAPAMARKYAEFKGLSYPILTDDEGKAQRAYGATTLPTIVLIDRKGNISTFVQGVIREAALDRAVRNLKRDNG